MTERQIQKLLKKRKSEQSNNELQKLLDCRLDLEQLIKITKNNIEFSSAKDLVENPHHMREILKALNKNELKHDITIVDNQSYPGDYYTEHIDIIYNRLMSYYDDMCELLSLEAKLNNINYQLSSWERK